MLKKIIAASTILLSTYSNAGLINGYTDVIDLGSGEYKFIFDTVSSDITNQDGLTFGYNGLSFDVTSNAGPVIQDAPSHGGLGVDGGAYGDNIGVDEVLYFNFNQNVEIVDFTLNGLFDSNGHTDVADAPVRFCYAVHACYLTDASHFDGVTPDAIPNGNTLPAEYSDTAYFEFSPAWFDDRDNFHGYIESLTVKVSVSEPGAFVLLGMSLFSLGFVRRTTK